MRSQQVTDDVVSYYTALQQEVKSHGAAQLLIVNPGVVLDKRLSQLVRLFGYSSSSHLVLFA